MSWVVGRGSWVVGRGSWVVGSGRRCGSWVWLWVWVNGVGKKEVFQKEIKIKKLNSKKL